MMKNWAFIPARLASQRLPNKMMLNETKKPLIVHTYENAVASKCFERVIVVSDSMEIVEAIRRHDDDHAPDNALHSPEFSSGTARVHWAANHQHVPSDTSIVNLQGDEPEIPHRALRDLISKNHRINTIVTNARNDMVQPSVVKAFLCTDNRVLYFSRLLPDNFRPACHVGVYKFISLDFLNDIMNRKERTNLDKMSNLEQMRWLELGYHIHAVHSDCPFDGIDTMPDYAAFVRRWRKKNLMISTG